MITEDSRAVMLEHLNMRWESQAVFLGGAFAIPLARHNDLEIKILN